MKATTFFDNFSSLIDATNGCDKLRETVLALGVTGKLTMQNDAEDARELFNDVEFLEADIPQNWCAVTLAETGEYNRNVSVKPDKNDQTALELWSVPSFSRNTPEETRVCDLGSSKPQVSPSDILLSKINPHINRVWQVRPAKLPQVASSEWIIIRKTVMFDKYLIIFLQSPSFRSAFYALRSGIGGSLTRVRPKEAQNIAVLCPPLEEQKRIVAKVDQLMALIDEIEEKQNQGKELQAAFNTSALAKLVEPQTPKQFNINFNRVSKNFDTLIQTPENVAKLKETILQLAVMGKLTEKERPRLMKQPDYEPASVLLEKIKAEKEKLIAEGKIKKPKPLPSIEADEVPYELPEGWEWVRLGELGYWLGGGTPSKNNSSFWGGDILWVSPKDMKFDLLMNSKDKITEIGLTESRLRLIPEQSLLFVTRGMILAHTFPAGIAGRELTINQDMKALVLGDNSISTYLLRAMKGLSPQVLNQVESSTHGTKRLQFEKLDSFVLALPPILEQLLISERTTAKLASCDEIETCLVQQNNTGENLVASMVHEMVG